MEQKAASTHRARENRLAIFEEFVAD